MHTVSCPLCGLRYTNAPQLALHVREDHAPPPGPERQEVIVVKRWHASAPPGAGPRG